MTALQKFCVCVTLLLAVASATYARDGFAGEEAYQEALRLIASGQKQEASDVLTHLIRDEPEHAGAWLDLAMLKCEMGDAEEAERLFAELAARFQLPPAILKAIAQRHAQGCGSVRSTSRVSLMLGRGFDDNVNQGASTPNFAIGSGSSRIELQLLPEYLPRRDSFTVLSGEVARNLNALGTTGFVQFHARGNDSLSQYDVALISVGAEHPWRVGNWRVRGAGMLSALGLGGALYQKQRHLQALISPPLPLPESLRFDLSAGVTGITYATLSNFDTTLYEIRSLLKYSTPQAQVQAMAGYSTDRASAARPGGDRRGWSASLQGNTSLTRNVSGELVWNRQTWHSESAYSPGLIDQVRQQTTDLLLVGIIVPVAAHHAVRLDLRQVRNKENLSIFQYNNRQVQLSWQWRGF